MSTYVLVHGAWGGAHTWKLVRPLLRPHLVFTPALTGIGERSHLASPQVDLSVHVRDVVNQIVYEDLSDIVLLGFSYGGMVVTGALDYIGDRVRELVYLDAFVPNDGESLNDLTGSGSSTGYGGLGEPWLVPPRPRDIDDAEEVAWNEPRRTAQPYRTFAEKVKLSKPIEQFGFGLTYMKALDDPIMTDRRNQFWDAADRARANDRWRYVETDTNHMIPQNRPHELADLLLALA
jgi:pimeloyl-ACP methyl ester carboxylesterase